MIVITCLTSTTIPPIMQNAVGVIIRAQRPIPSNEHSAQQLTAYFDELFLWNHPRHGAANSPALRALDGAAQFFQLS